MFIKITNQGEIKPEALELLGYSTKRNNEATIGEKGTGLKFSLIQACRDGIDFAVATADFICTATAEKIDAENSRIVLNYKRKKYKNIKKVKTSFTIYAGHQEWTDDWFILREVLQNAVDTELELELSRFGVNDSIGDLVPNYLSEANSIDYAEKGKTSVFIKKTGRLFSVLNNIENYFVTKQIEKNYKGKILPKKDSKLRIYKKGILIQDFDKKSIFDYSLNYLELTEARKVADDFDMKWETRYLLNNSSIESKKKIINSLIQDENLYEGSLGDFESNDWRKAFELIYSEDVIITNEIYENKKVIKNAQKSGKNVIIIKNYNLFNSLEKLGVPTLKNWKKEKFEYNFIPFAVPQNKKVGVDKILEFFNYNNQIRFYDDITEEAGFYNQKENYIALSVSTALSSDLYSTLVHELIHWKFKVEDESRAYQDICTDLISKLLTK